MKPKLNANAYATTEINRYKYALLKHGSVEFFKVQTIFVHLHTCYKKCNIYDLVTFTRIAREKFAETREIFMSFK